MKDSDVWMLICTRFFIYFLLSDNTKGLIHIIAGRERHAVFVDWVSIVLQTAYCNIIVDLYCAECHYAVILYSVWLPLEMFKSGLFGYFYGKFLYVLHLNSCKQVPSGYP